VNFGTNSGKRKISEEKRALRTKKKIPVQEVSLPTPRARFPVKRMAGKKKCFEKKKIGRGEGKCEP